MSITESQVNELKKAATEASNNAYCPYSNFPVGAAVLIESGRIITGCNIENASYSLTLCAERNAIFSAISKHGKCKILAVAIYTPTKTPTTPCGPCRQTIIEFNKKTKIYSFCKSKKTIKTNIEELLPNPFNQNNLNK